MKMNFSYLCIILLVIIVILLWYILKNINEEQEYYSNIDITNPNDICRQFYEDYYITKIKDKKRTNYDKNIRDKCIPKLNNFIVDSLPRLESSKCKNNNLVSERDDSLDPTKCYVDPDYKFHRDYFLSGWNDVNGDKCNTRNELLAKFNNDSNNLKYKDNNSDKCIIELGDWSNYYTLHKDKDKYVEYTYNSVIGDKIEPPEKLYYIPDDDYNKDKCYSFVNDKNETTYTLAKNIISLNGFGEENAFTISDMKSKISSAYNIQNKITPYNNLINGECLVELKDEEEDENKEYFYLSQNKKVPLIDIDHVVPLKNAWISGAWKWSPWQMKAYANDMTPGHLEISPAVMNRSKSDKSIDLWYPSIFNKSSTKTYSELKDITIDDKADCYYASNYASVKHRWNLGVTDDEVRKMKEIFNNNKCKDVLSESKVDFNNIGISLEKSNKYSDLYEYNFSDNSQNIFNDLQTKYLDYCKSDSQDKNDFYNLKKNIIKSANNLQLWNEERLSNKLNSNNYKVNKVHKKELCNIIFPDIKQNKQLLS